MFITWDSDEPNRNGNLHGTVASRLSKIDAVYHVTANIGGGGKLATVKIERGHNTLVEDHIVSAGSLNGAVLVLCRRLERGEEITDETAAPVEEIDDTLTVDDLALDETGDDIGDDTDPED